MTIQEKTISNKNPSEPLNKQLQAYEHIKYDILNNIYPQGTVLSERKLCELYDMSRSPIRNALQQLAHEGLISFIPGKGTAVASFTTEDILEVYDLIENLQTFAIRSCMVKMTEDTLSALRQALSNMHSSLETKDIYQCTRWDQKFHELIVEYSGNSRLQTIYNQLDNQQMLFIATILKDIPLAERSYLEHLNIYNAIESKDISSAQDAVRIHYKNIKQYYIDKLLNRIHI